MVKRAATAAEKRHLARVASLGCVLCRQLCIAQTTFTQVHHIREGQGTSQRASHWLTVPLCEFCHTGPTGVHGDRTLLRIAKLEELDLLALTIEELIQC